MSDKQTLAVLDERNYPNQWITLVLEEVKGFIGAERMRDLIDSKTKRTLRELGLTLLEGYFRYAISRQLPYCEGESTHQEFVEYLSEHLALFLARVGDPKLNSDEIAQVTTEAVEDILQSDAYTEMDVECHRQIQQLIPPALRWRKCALVTMGGYFAVSIGRDYRILEYERMVGETTDEEMSYDFTGLFGVLRHRIVGALGTDGKTLPFRVFVVKELERLVPELVPDNKHHSRNVHTTEEVIQSIGAGLSEAQLKGLCSEVTRIVSPVAHLMVQQISPDLVEGETYLASLTNSGILTLSIDQSDPTPSQIKAIIRAYENGDYIPERERRLAGL